MCVILYKKKESKIDLETLLLARNTNPDGMGLAYFDGNEVIFERNLKPNKNDLKACIKKTEDKEAIFHFRIATSGGINIENCQPVYNKGANFLLFHNGVVHSLNGVSATASDTVLLSYLLEHNEVDKNKLLEKIAIKTFSKFVLINEFNQIFLFGDFKDYKGLLCSNLNFVPRPPMPAPAKKEKAPMYKNYSDFFESRRTHWEDDLIYNGDY